MGSTSFSQTHYTTSDYKQAYNDLVDEARAEYGYDPYNGTISTTSGVTLVPTERPLTEAEATKLSDKRIHNLSKWENVEAIALVAPESIKERKVVRKVKITAKQIKEAGSLRGALQAAVKKSVTLREGEVYQGFHVNQENYRDKASLKYRGVMVPTEGKAVIRYFIIRDGYMNNFEWKNGFATMAAARKRLTEIVNAEDDGYRHFSDSVNYEIVGQTRREDGSPLLRAAREISGAEYEVTVTVAKIAAKPKTGGFFFYGWAAE